MTSIREAGREQRYGLTLILILSSLIFIMAAPNGTWSDLTALALLGGSLLASLRAARSNRYLRIACAVLVALALIFALFQALFTDDNSELFVRMASLFLVVLATPVMVHGMARQVKREKQVTIFTMLGVLCIYLLMALAFAEAFGLIQVIEDEPFFRNGQGAEDLSNYLYFSITTITTAGLGDFSPAGDLGRSLTGGEALIGQIYLVTVVAVIVANLGRRR
ncbi:MAG: two pore domain potassium channel family protein [Thermoleophilia bacterium]|nr:two pore domain potassium channel family protein [Thermoleophilia bacterium]